MGKILRASTCQKSGVESGLLGILLGLFFCSFSGCNSFFEEGLIISYSVSLADVEKQTLSVEMQVKDKLDRNQAFRLPTFDEFTEVVDISAKTDKGEPLKIRIEEKVERVSAEQVTQKIFYIESPEISEYTISYEVAVGKKIHKQHGKQAYHTYGYLAKDFALLSGRSLFLLPEQPISKVFVSFDLPADWQVSVPWEKSKGLFQPRVEQILLKEELANTTIALGHLDMRKMEVGNTPVTIAMYALWPSPFKDQLASTCFETYKAVASEFGGDQADPYVFNFLPKTLEDLMINPTSWSSSQGMECFPFTSERWMVIAKNLINRWIKYPPTRMTYKSRKDFWVISGLRTYLAINIGEKLGILDKSYRDKMRANFEKNINDKSVSNFAVLNRNPKRRPPVFNVEKFYESESNRLKRKREETAPFVVSFLDAEIQKITDGKQGLRELLHYEYKKKSDLDFFQDLRAIFGKDFEGLVKPLCLDLRLLVQRLQMISNISSVPSLFKEPLRSEISDTLQIILTGNTKGFLEHCGCKVNQNGGVARRATIIEQVRKKNPDLLLIDAGNFFPYPKMTYRMTDQIEKEFDIYLRTLDYMQYDIAGLAFYEMLYGIDFYLKKRQEIAFPMVCANVSKNGSHYLPPTISIKRKGMSIGFIGVFEMPYNRYSGRPVYLFQDRSPSVTIENPIDAIKRNLSEAQSENDLTIIIGEILPKTVEEISKISGIDLIISTNYAWNKLAETEFGITLIQNDLSGFHNDAMVLYDNQSLYGLTLVDIYLNKNKKILGAKIRPKTLDDSVEEHHHVREIIDNFYDRSFALNTHIDPLIPFSEDRFLNAEFIGANACKMCHSQQHDQWMTTAHATAFNTLLDVKRHYQPECVKCHVTGAGLASGYKMGDLTHPLLNVQCEMCHGPGSKHVSNPVSAKMIKTPPKSLCITCHDAEHSDFVFETYYPKVKHQPGEIF